MTTDVNDFIGELGAGVFEEKLAVLLSKCAEGTVVNGGGNKKGKVTIELILQKVGENDQVIISHKLSSVIPTKRGKKSEEDTTETPFFVGRGGVLSINPPREEATGQKPFQLHTSDKKGNRS